MSWFKVMCPYLYLTPWREHSLPTHLWTPFNLIGSLPSINPSLSLIMFLYIPFLFLLDFPSECPAGQHMNECGNLCQQTCDHILSGNQIVCATVCGPPACTCPEGLVLFRDRCVDPRLCYILNKCESLCQCSARYQGHMISHNVVL